MPTLVGSPSMVVYLIVGLAYEPQRGNVAYENSVLYARASLYKGFTWQSCILRRSQGHDDGERVRPCPHRRIGGFRLESQSCHREGSLPGDNSNESGIDQLVCLPGDITLGLAVHRTIPT